MHKYIVKIKVPKGSRILVAQEGDGIDGIKIIFPQNSNFINKGIDENIINLEYVNNK